MTYPIADNFKRNPDMKPTVQFTGADGNVFNLLGICSRALRRMPNAFNELRDRVFQAKSYDEAIQIMMEYVDVE